MRQPLAAAVALGFAVALVPTVPAFADGIRDDQWHLRYLKAEEAQEKTRGAGVTVAVVDNGVDRNHVDLAASVLPAAFVGAGDVGSSPAGVDPDGHGTALAGLVAGQGHGANREHGVLGIAPDAQILPVVVGSPATPDASGVRGADPDQLAAGIELATRRGAKVIVVGYSVAGSTRLAQAVREARDADAIVVAADGNRAGEAFEPYPAAYDGVLAAVPLSRSGEVLVRSDSGRRLGFGVPGEEIMTTNTGGGYRVDAGNASAGLLAGAVALVRAAYPKLPADEIVHRLSETAVDAGEKGQDAEYGQGRLDLVPALTRVVPLAHPPTPSAAPPASAAATATPTVAPVALPPRSRGRLGWLLALPLLAVIGALALYAVRAERRLGRSVVDGIDSGGASS